MFGIPHRLVSSLGEVDDAQPVVAKQRLAAGQIELRTGPMIGTAMTLRLERGLDERGRVRLQTRTDSAGDSAHA